MSFLTVSLSGQSLKERLFDLLQSDDTVSLQYAIRTDFRWLETLHTDTLTAYEDSLLSSYAIYESVEKRILASTILWIIDIERYTEISHSFSEYDDSIQFTGYLPNLSPFYDRFYTETPVVDTALFSYLYRDYLFSDRVSLIIQEAVFGDYELLRYSETRDYIPLIRYSESIKLREMCIYFLTDIPQLDMAKCSLYLEQEEDSIKRQIVINECVRIDEIFELSATILRDFIHGDSVETIQVQALGELVKLDTLTEKELQVARILLTSENYSTYSSACHIVSAAKDTLSLPILIKRIPKEKEMYTRRDSDALFAMFKILTLPHDLNSNDHYHVTFPEEYFKVAQCDWNSREAVLQCEYEQAIKLIEWWKREAGVDECLTR